MRTFTVGYGTDMYSLVIVTEIHGTATLARPGPALALGRRKSSPAPARSSSRSAAGLRGPSEVHHDARRLGAGSGQQQCESGQQRGGGAGTQAGSRVTILVPGAAAAALTEDAGVSASAQAALVVVAGAAVLTQQQLVVTDVGCVGGGERQRNVDSY